MKKKLSPQDFFIYLVFLTAITFNIVDTTFKFMQIQYEPVIILIISIFTLAYLWAITNYKYSFIIILIPILILNPSRIIGYIKYMVDNFQGFLDNMFYGQYLEEQYIKIYNLLLYAIIIFALVGIYYVVVIRKNTAILLIIGSAIYVSYYFFGSNNLFKSCSTYLILNIILYAYNEYMKRKNHWSSQDMEVRRNYFYRWISLTVILVVLTSFLTQMFKYDVKPVTFDWFEENIISRFEDLTNIGTGISDSSFSSRFSLIQTGFQQDPKRLGGPIQDDKSIAFRLTAKDDFSNIHLRGSIQNSYDGHVWSKTDKENKKYKDNIENIAPNVTTQIKSIMITPEKTITSTAFNPLYPLYVKNSWGYYFVGSDYEVFNPKAVRRGKNYEVQFNDYKPKDLQNLIKTHSQNAKEVTYAEDIKKYLVVPEIVPQRVKNLAQDITSKYSTPLEKAAAIEAYLKKEFKYSKETSIVPDDRDFVDYFLYDEKKGYCTYFATTMAVMCRLVNIPTRYVEGYAISGSVERNEEINVLNADAHAWVEVYFNDVGWVTFDPTPGMSSIGDDIIKVENPGGETPGEEPNPDDVRPNPERPKPNPENPSEPGQTEETVQNESSLNPGIVIFPVLGILAVSLIVLMISLLRYRKKNYLAYSIQKLIIYGGALNLKYLQGETAREYITRLARKLSMDLDEYINIFEGNLYGKKKLTREEHKRLSRMFSIIRKDIIEEKGRIRFSAYEIIHTLLIPFRFKISS